LEAKVLRVLTCGLLVLAAATCGFGQSLITNFSFESGDLSGWRAVSYYTQGSMAVVTGAGDAPDGTCYFRITGSGNTGPQVAAEPLPTNYDLLPNAQYRLTFKWRCSNTNFVLNYGRPYYQGAVFGNTAIESFAPGTNPLMATAANQWQTETRDINTPSHDTYYRWTGIQFGGYAYPLTPVGTVDVDDIRLELRSPIPTSVTHNITPAGLGTYEYSNLKCRIKWNSVSEAGDSTVQMFTGAPPDIGGRAHLSRWWTISPFPGTFSAQPIFMYTDEELTAAGLQGIWEIRVLKQEGSGPWQEVSRTYDTTRKIITVNTPQTSFSNWTIAGPVPAGIEDWMVFE
jgi:hypothetical protein